MLPVVQCSLVTLRHSCQWMVVHTCMEFTNTGRNRRISRRLTAYTDVGRAADVATLRLIETLVVVSLIPIHLNRTDSFIRGQLASVIWDHLYNRTPLSPPASSLPHPEVHQGHQAGHHLHTSH